jgi:hypothetical protein
MKGLLISALVQNVFLALTPHLRELLEVFARDFARRAAATPNRADDIAAAFLLGLVGVGPEEE